MKIKVKVVPATGRGRELTIEPKSGETLRASLTAAGIGVEGFNVLVNGEPANLDAELTVDVTVREVQVTERPRGS